MIQSLSKRSASHLILLSMILTVEFVKARRGVWRIGASVRTRAGPSAIAEVLEFVLYHQFQVRTMWHVRLVFDCTMGKRMSWSVSGDSEGGRLKSANIGIAWRASTSTDLWNLISSRRNKNHLDHWLPGECFTQVSRPSRLDWSTTLAWITPTDFLPTDSASGRMSELRSKEGRSPQKEKKHIYK